MPELPEVHTTVTGLQKLLPEQKIVDVWTDLKTRNHNTNHLRESLKDTRFLKLFKKEVIGKKVLSAKRRGKNILINLSNYKTILIHMKMTGHIMVGKYSYDKKKNIWAPAETEKNEALRDPFNRFIHVVFLLSNGKQVVLSDVRKFAKVTLIESGELDKSIHLKHLGPEPLSKEFTLVKFTEQLLLRPKNKIKMVLLDQKIVAGIGNIYSDELLWLSSVHPASIVGKIPQKLFKIIFENMKLVLKKGISLGGDSMSDYRDVFGKRGKFQNTHNVYRKKGLLCGKPRCKGKIERIVIGGRSTHFCNIHQKLFV